MAFPLASMSVRHRALIIRFENSHLAAEIDRLEKVFNDLNWDVKVVELSSDDSVAARSVLDTQVTRLLQRVKANPASRDKMIIYYGGYAFQDPSLSNVWKWHASGGVRCKEHTVQVDPEPALQSLLHDTPRDTLFLFHSPFELEASRIENSPLDPRDNHGRNVEVVAFREQWSLVQSNLSRPIQCAYHKCRSDEIMRAPFHATSSPTKELTNFLELMDTELRSAGGMSVKAFTNGSTSLSDMWPASAESDPIAAYAWSGTNALQFSLKND